MAWFRASLCRSAWVRALLLDRDARDVGGGVDQPQLLVARRARLVVVHRERAEHPPLRREDRRRPARAQAELRGRRRGTSPTTDPSRMSVTMTRVPRYIAVPHEPVRGTDGQAVDRVDVVGGQARRRAVADGHAILVEQEHGAQHAVALLFDESHHAVEHVRQRTAGGNHLEHLVLRGAERLLAAPLGDVARDREQLDDGAARVGDRRHDGVPPLDLARRRRHHVLKAAVPATPCLRDAVLRGLSDLAFEEARDRTIQQPAGVGRLEHAQPAGLM